MAYVEHDQIARTQEMPYLPSFDAFADSVSNLIDAQGGPTHKVTEKGAPWGLARISHRNQLKLSTFTKYEYVEEGGEGVDAYVIDTGEFV